MIIVFEGYYKDLHYITGIKNIIEYRKPFKEKKNKFIMNKWAEILIGLILVIAVIVFTWFSGDYNWGSGFWNFRHAAWEVLKGGAVWFVLGIGLLFLMLGISDLRS